METCEDPQECSLTAASTTHRLVGLEPDNLLAFLGLLGLLRALDKEKPTWGSRVRWDCETLPIRPVLLLKEEATETAVAQAAAAGCEQLATTYRFSEAEKKWEFPRLKADEVRQELLATIALGPEARARADLLAALASDGAATDAGAAIPTPLCLLFGQGHQFFLSRLAEIARPTPLSGSKGRKRAVRSPTAAIARALFRPWERADVGPSLRWDTGLFDRQYSHRFSDPGINPVQTEAGAYTLAAIGLPILTVSPTTMWRRVRLRALCVHEDATGLSIVWPLWTKWSSLESIRALLAHPAIYQEPPDKAALGRLGVHEVRRATRINQGKYRNFKRGLTVRECESHYVP